MGTNTDFTGAIRITPCVEEPLATRLKQFMDIRHMKRNVKTLHTLFPDLEDRKPMSLFGDGDFGEEGALVGALRLSVSRSPLWMSAGSATIRAI